MGAGVRPNWVMFCGFVLSSNPDVSKTQHGHPETPFSRWVCLPQVIHGGWPPFW